MVGDQLTLQLPVWGSQGHWCSHLQGLWQPGPYQPSGHSAGRSQEDSGGAPVARPLSALSGCARVCRAGLTQEHPLGGAPSWLTQGTFLLTLHTGVSSEARGTGAGPLHGVTGGSIMTLTLLGAVFPEEATGASWGGKAVVSARPGPALPSQAGAQGIENASSSPPGALLVHVFSQKAVLENVPRGRAEATPSWSLCSAWAAVSGLGSQ